MNTSYLSMKRGFTIIELLVTMSIISLLSSVVITSTQTARTSANNAKFISEMHSLQTALGLYRSNHPDSAFPDCSIGLSQCTEWGSANGINFDTGLSFLISGGYISKIPRYATWPNYDANTWVYSTYYPSYYGGGAKNEYACSPVPVSYSAWHPGMFQGMTRIDTPATMNLPLQHAYTQCTDSATTHACLFTTWPNNDPNLGHSYCLPFGDY